MPFFFVVLLLPLFLGALLCRVSPPLFFFVFSGFWFGLIHSLGALVGTVAGVLVAGHNFEQGAQFFAFLGNENLAKVVAFVAIFILASRLVGIVFAVINKIFKLIAIIPFLKTFNRLGGALLGFLEGSIILGLILIFIGKFPFSDFIVPAINGSEIAQWLLRFGALLAPLLPEAVELIKSQVPLPF